MVSTRKKKQQQRRLLSCLGEVDADFLIEQSNHGVEIESRDELADSGTSIDNANNPTQFNYPQVSKHTLEENIKRKVRSELNCVMTRVKNRVQDAVSKTTKELVSPREKLAITSANAMSLQDGVLTVTYWKLTRQILREISKVYGRMLEVE